MIPLPLQARMLLEEHGEDALVDEKEERATSKN